MLLSRLEPAPIFPAARATATGTMSAMKASTAGVIGPSSRRRAQNATVGPPSPSSSAWRISMCLVQLSALGSTGRLLMRAADSSGAPTAGIGTYCPVSPSSDGDARRADGDEGGLLVGQGSHEDLSGALADRQPLDLPRRRCRP